MQIFLVDLRGGTKQETKLQMGNLFPLVPFSPIVGVSGLVVRVSDT